MSRPYELGRPVYMPNRSVYEFYVEVDPDVVERSRVLVDLSSVFSSREVPIVHLKLSRPTPGEAVSMIIFADLTGRGSSRHEIARGLEDGDCVSRVEVVEPLVDGFIADRVMFPLTF